MHSWSVVSCAVLVLGLQAEQGSEPAQKTDPSAATGIAAQLRAEADQLKKGHASRFFEALIQAIESGDHQAIRGQLPPMLKNADEATRDALRAPALVRQADRVAREVLRFCLSRAPAPATTPPGLEEWKRLKAKVVGHAEAIVLEGVLRPDEVRRWKPQTSRPLMPQLPGRYSIIPIDYPDGLAPRANTREAFHRAIHQMQFQRRSSDLFDILLGHARERPISAEQPPAAKQQFPGLTPDQVRVLEDVDLLARNAMRYWLVRDVEPPPGPRDADPHEIRELPPTRAMEFRLSDQGLRVRASIVAHAEEMVLDEILRPEQLEKARIELWRRRGVHALLDPELAARLHLSRAQRDELAMHLANRLQPYHQLVRSAGYIASLVDKPAEEIARLEQQAREVIAQKVAVLDQPIWECLRPSQLRSLARLLDKPVAGYPPPSTKPSRKPAVRSG